MIPHTKGQQCDKRFHVITPSCFRNEQSEPFDHSSIRGRQTQRNNTFILPDWPATHIVVRIVTLANNKYNGNGNRLKNSEDSAMFSPLIFEIYQVPFHVCIKSLLLKACYFVLYWIVSHCIVLHCIVLYLIIVHCIISLRLHCFSNKDSLNRNHLNTFTKHLLQFI